MAVLSRAPESAPAVRVLSAPEPGRVRLAVDGLQGSPPCAGAVETVLGRLAGVRAVSGNVRTGNVLVFFDATRCSVGQVVHAAAQALGLRDLHAQAPPDGELAVRSATPGRLRLAVHGLHRRPDREAIVADALVAVPGVRVASASAPTGTALVLYDPSSERLPALLARLQSAVQARLAARGVDDTDHASEDSGRQSALRPLTTDLQPPLRNPWARSAPEVLRQLDVEPAHGLTADEVAERRARWGTNRLAEPADPPLLGLFADQFKNAPSALLAAGTVLSLATGALVEAALIAGVLVVNAAIGTATERSGQRAIKALRRGISVPARVRRDGVEQVVEADELVPGDVILLRPGDPVPADARLVSAERLRVEESALTGESQPVAKHLAACAARTPLADRTCMVHRGTTVAGGHGAAVVVATGDQTAYGALRLLAVTAEPPPTPLERDLAALGRTVAFGATAVCGAVLGLSLLRGAALVPALTTAIGLGVAAIPEALPTIATTVLAFGSGRMRRKGTLIRTLSAAEALGSVTHVCADKTGTLTENRMAVRELYVEGRTVTLAGAALASSGTFTADGQPLAPLVWPALREALTIGALCSDAELLAPAAASTPAGPTNRVPTSLGARHSALGAGSALAFDGSPTEGALLVAAAKAGLDVAALQATHPVRDRRDRNESRRYMLTVHRRAGRLVALVKGSPEAVLALCDRVAAGDETVPLTAAQRAALDRRNTNMAGRAMRVLGFAARELPDAYESADLQQGFTWYSLAGLADPIRPQVPAAIRALHRAGIRTIMITGDQAPTAVAIARELGLSRRGALDVLEAHELAALPPDVLRERVREVGIFARIPPEMKLAVVRALQANGKIVAMTGDGVNDAPALRAADVGVAMGEQGTELARELADVVLSTDDFSQMVDAVEEGRLVRANVQRVLHYLLTTNASEVWTVLAATALGLSTPLNALQLLWLNVVTDVAPAFALAVEPRDPALMAQPPRDPKESIVARPFLARIVGESLPMALAALAVYGIGLRRYGPGPAAQTMAFATLVGSQLLHAPLARVGHRPATLGAHAPNRWLLGALGVSGALQLAALFVPPLRLALGGAALRLADLGIALAGALVAVGTLEAERVVRHTHARRHPMIARSVDGDR
jgi:P-type Ca2+ transporter type 2C